jgi:hypothetical protein
MRARSGYYPVMIDIKIEGLESIPEAIEKAVKSGTDDIVEKQIAEELAKLGLTRDQVDIERTVGPDGSISLTFKRKSPG